VIAKTMHSIFCVCYKGGSASPKTMRKQTAEGPRFLTSRTKACSILNVRWATAVLVANALRTMRSTFAFAKGG
jgi:hypothetical protein